jgi:plasmid replication initiation protein
MANKEKNLVVSRKPNKVIEARQGLSAFQHKILFSVFAQFRTKILNTKIETAKEYKETIQTKYKVKLSDIIPELKKQRITQGSDFLNDIEKASKDLMKQLHEVQTNNGWKAYSLVDFVEFYREELEIEVRIAASMTEEILRWFKEGFTQIPVKEIMPLRSKYSIRIFEILLRVMNIPGVKEDGYTISYEELRKKLGISEKEYKVYKDFNVRVLQQAQKEIHEKTFMRFEYRKEVERFPPAINICFSNISHKVKEILPMQLEIFDFEKQEADEDKQVIKNATANLDFIEKRERATECFYTSEKFAEERRELERDAAKSSIDMKYTAEDIKKMRDSSYKFTEEQLKKLEKYLDGFFSANEIKAMYDFDYIEFYYNKAVEKNSKGTLKDFAGFLYSLLKSDKDNFYELKEKEAQKQAEQAALRRAEFERKKEEREQERIKKENEKKELEEMINVFDLLDEKIREMYLNKVYAANSFLANLDKGKEVSLIAKMLVIELIKKEQN